MPRSPQYPVPALEKGLDVLEALAAAAVPQSLSELAARLGRSSSELFRMLACLERREYITRDGLSGRYSLTLKLFSLAHTHSPTEKLLHAARRPMQALTETVRESCHLTALDRGRLLVLAQEESPEPVRVSIEPGSVFDPVRTASGRLLLAQLAEAERAVVLKQSPAGRRLKGAALAAFHESLEAVRRQGLSCAEGETIDGVRDIAIPVGSPAKGFVAALVITRLVRRGQRADEAALIAALRRTAAEISRTLGLHG